MGDEASRAQESVDYSSEMNREYAIKAAYLYQFGRYVQWPAASFPDSESPVIIGLLGTDPFGVILEEIARTKQLEGRPIAIRRFAAFKDYTPCHILFINSSIGAEQEAAAIRKTRGTPVLLVGDSPEFAKQGGAIRFFIDENRVRFEINPEAARQNDLKISSKLLSLAKIVE